MVYGGIDPGRTGGIAAIDFDGTVKVWAMPRQEQRGVCLPELFDILRSWPNGTAVGLEWNQARPGESPDYAFRFGLQTGEIHAALFGVGFSTILVSPQAWMNKLGLCGKRDDPKMIYRMAFVRDHYPWAEPLFIGPRGGIQDGPLEALLIAHYVKLVRSTPFGAKSGPRQPKFRGIPPENLLSDETGV